MIIPIHATKEQEKLVAAFGVEIHLQNARQVNLKGQQFSSLYSKPTLVREATAERRATTVLTKPEDVDMDLTVPVVVDVVAPTRLRMRATAQAPRRQWTERRSEAAEAIQ